MKSKKIYKQMDKQWRNLPYPTAGSKFGGNGCGACSVLHCIIERDKYSKWTPADIQPYMKRWAEPGHGTLWKGIYEALKYYGMENVKWIGVNDPMSDVWKECNKKNRIGVILFGSTKGPDGTVWTEDGHYIAFTDYKYENKKHYFYLKDSGPRDHDGWYCYEKSMRGDVRQVWTCTLPKEVDKVTTDKKKETKKQKRGVDVSAWQGEITKAEWLKAKNAGVSFAIIRAGYSVELRKDSKFAGNYKAAKAAGIPVGVYYYSTAKNTDEAVKEAKYLVKILKDVDAPELPVYIDYEDPDATKRIGAEQGTDIVNAFCATVKKAGYRAGVYASLNYLRNKLIPKKFGAGISVWVAQYNDKCDYTGKYDIWQYSSKGSITGLGKPIDKNILYNEDIIVKKNQ